MARWQSYQKVIISFILCLGDAVPAWHGRAFIDYSSIKYVRTCRTPKALWETSKAAKAQTDCGATTSKNGVASAFEVRCVHLRLRSSSLKCTTDCGLETAESPALRGFVGERRPQAATSLYLVIFSNGQAASEIGPKSDEVRSVKWPFGTGFHRLLFSALKGRRQRRGWQGTAPSQRSHTAAYTGKRGVRQSNRKLVLFASAHRAIAQRRSAFSAAFATQVEPTQHSEIEDHGTAPHIEGTQIAAA